MAVYRQRAVFNRRFRAVDRCGHPATAGRADLNIIGRDFLKCCIHLCRFKQVVDGVAVLFGGRTGNLVLAGIIRIPALDLIAGFRHCRKDDGRAGRLFFAGLKRRFTVLCRQRAVAARNNAVVYRIGHSVQHVCRRNYGVLRDIERERFCRFGSRLTVYRPAVKGIAGCALRRCRKGNTRIANNRIAACKLCTVCRCRNRAGEGYCIRRADDFNLNIHADIVRYAMGKGRTDFAGLLDAVYIPAFHLIAVIQTGNGKGDRAVGIRHRAGCKFRCIGRTVRRECRRQLRIMLRRSRAVRLETVGHFFASRVKLNLNRLSGGVCNRNLRLTVLLCAVQLPYANLVAVSRRCRKGDNRIAVNRELASFRFWCYFSVITHALAGDGSRQRTVRAAVRARRLVDNRPVDLSGRDFRPDRRDSLVLLYVIDGVGLFIGRSGIACAGNVTDLKSLVRCQRNDEVFAEVNILTVGDRAVCGSIHSTRNRNRAVRSIINGHHRLCAKRCREFDVAVDFDICNRFGAIFIIGQTVNLAVLQFCLNFRCNKFVLARRCRHRCYRTVVDILDAICIFFRFHRHIIHLIRYRNRAVCRLFYRYNRLRANHHIDRSRGGQTVDGIGKGFAVSICSYLCTVYRPLYDLILRRFRVGNGDRAVSRASRAVRDRRIICRIFCGQRAAVRNGSTVLIHDTESNFRGNRAIVHQCANPNIALQILNRIAESGNVRRGPCTVRFSLVLPADNTHCGRQLCSQRNRRAFLALAVRQTGGFERQRNNRIRICLLNRRIVHFILRRCLKGDAYLGIRSNRQFELLAAEIRTVCVLLSCGRVTARNRPLFYNIAVLRRCRKGDFGSAQNVIRCNKAAYCRSYRTVFVALRRYRVELVGELKLYVQIIVQCCNRQSRFVIRKSVVCTLGQLLPSGFYSPLRNLIVFPRLRGEKHPAAGCNGGTAFECYGITALIAEQFAVISMGIGDCIRTRLHKHHRVSEHRRILGEELCRLCGKVRSILIVHYADIVYTGGSLVPRHTLCLKQTCVIIVINKAVKVDFAALHRGSCNRNRLFRYRNVLACYHLVVFCCGDAIAARSECGAGSPALHNRRTVLISGIADALSIRSGSTAGRAIDRYFLQARRNQVAIDAIFYFDFIEFLFRLRVIDKRTAARSCDLAVAAVYRDNAVNARLARCPLISNRILSRGLVYRIACNITGRGVRDFESDRAVGRGGGIVKSPYRCSQSNLLACYLFLAAGNRNLCRFDCTGLEQLSVAFIQTRFHRQTAVSAAILRIIGAVQLVNRFRTIRQNRIAARIRFIDFRQAVLAVLIGICVADGVRLCHLNEAIIILAVILSICITIQRQRILLPRLARNGGCGINRVFRFVDFFCFLRSPETVGADFIHRAVQRDAVLGGAQRHGRAGKRTGKYTVGIRRVTQRQTLHQKILILAIAADISAVNIGIQCIDTIVRICILLIRLFANLILRRNGFLRFSCGFIGCVAAGCIFAC